MTRLILALLAVPPLAAQQQQQPEDPFAGLPAPSTASVAPEPRARKPWTRALFTENFGFRKELMSQFTVNEDGGGASRQSVGFEALKKFSTATSTVASFNVQIRAVRRDGFNPVQNDREGESRPGWAFEYHNLYLDFYNILNPLLPAGAKGKNTGRFNFRAGRFYVPFGLNPQTDTHGTLLQLSNDRNFGFERDWFAGFWGALNSHVNYDIYYMAGSGYRPTFEGQRGLAAVRLSLGSRYAARYGLEGGVSVISGERLPHMYAHRHPIETRREGGDIRYRRPVPSGLLTLTAEVSRGSDNRVPVTMLLNQGEYTHRSRRWGAATQYRRYAGPDPESSIIGEFTWYFRNDPGSSSLHWIKFNAEHRSGPVRPGRPRAVFALQYYFYR